MNWLTRLLGKSSLPAGDRRALAMIPAPAEPVQLTLHDCRFVVVDVESTGLNMQKDLLLSIGAVAIQNEQIRLADQFEAVLTHANADTRDTVLLHGLGSEAIATGDIPAEVLLRFYQWSGPAVFFAFHSVFDQSMVERATREHFGMVPPRLWLDLAVCLPAFFPKVRDGLRSLDDWAGYFRLDNHARHEAAADAFVTAELALILLRAARRDGLTTVADLQKKIRLYQQLEQMKSH